MRMEDGTLKANSAKILPGPSIDMSLPLAHVTFDVSSTSPNFTRISNMASSGGNDTQALNDLIASTLGLLQQFATSISATSTTPHETTRIDNPPNPLQVLGDSAKLVKAHTTKLSLLAINKPFTPSAITKVLKELSSTCLPAMMSAVQICEQEKAVWGSMMGREVQLRVQRVFKELQSLLQELQSIAAGTQAQVGRRDTLSSTGVVWESCDAMIELEKRGLGGLAVQKAEQYRDTIKDAIEELKEWAEGDDLEHEGTGDALLDDDDEGVDGDKDSIEDIFNAANSMPKDRPELKALADEADGKLKKIAILYEALLKRRIKTFRHYTEGTEDTARKVARLDELMLHLKRMPHQADELASCLYDLDEATARAALQKVVDEGKAAASGMGDQWGGGEDAFTEWIVKWIDAVG